MEITTVADDLVVMHDGHDVYRYEGLKPATEYLLNGLSVTTLTRPEGELLCRFATVNDVHFGELECGKIDDNPEGPIQRSRPGEPPYPITMNTGAIAEISALEPHMVFVKGDLTCFGSDDEFAQFETHYRGTFGDRLRVVRGNHDAYLGQHVHEGDQWVELPGATIALMDTTIPGQTTGDLTPEQILWLDDHAGTSDRRVIVMGHHQQWIADESGERSHGDSVRSDNYFGLHPDSSDALDDVFARHRNLIAYTAGHTHRHRVRTMRSGAVSVEVGCVKDFPGTWAEYRVYEGGVMQVVHRISSPEALDWSERCRHLYSDFGIDYETYALGSLDWRCFTIPERM